MSYWEKLCSDCERVIGIKLWIILCFSIIMGIWSGWYSYHEWTKPQLVALDLSCTDGQFSMISWYEPHTNKWRLRVHNKENGESVLCNLGTVYDRSPNHLKTKKMELILTPDGRVFDPDMTQSDCIVMKLVTE